MADCSFPRTGRLLKPGDFRSVFKGSQYKVSCRHFLILAISNQQTQSRLGIIVAKKHIAKAVQRNRLKRLIREWFRRDQGFQRHLDLVVLVRKDADKLSNSQLTDKLSRQLRDLNTKTRASTL